MTACPKCGMALTKPERKLENSAFCLALYTCTNCGTQTKIECQHNLILS